MFIFNRPFQPVAAGLAVPLLFVCLDRSCQPLDATPDRPSVASRQAALVTAHSRLRTTGHDSMQDMIIIGGGAVINALGLSQAGICVTVIEAEPQIINSPRAAMYLWPVLEDSDAWEYSRRPCCDERPGNASGAHC